MSHYSSVYFLKTDNHIQMKPQFSETLTLIPYSCVHLQKAPVAHLLKDFPTFYRTRSSATHWFRNLYRTPSLSFSRIFQHFTEPVAQLLKNFPTYYRTSRSATQGFPNILQNLSLGYTPISKPLQNPVTQLLKNFPTLYRSRRFLTVFTTASHGSLPRVRQTFTTSNICRYLGVSHITSPSQIMLYNTYVKCGSAGKCRQKCLRKFRDEIVPSRQTIHNLVNKLRTGLLSTESLLRRI
jgi:hypothetical protein